MRIIKEIIRAGSWTMPLRLLGPSKKDISEMCLGISLDDKSKELCATFTMLTKWHILEKNWHVFLNVFSVWLTKSLVNWGFGDFVFG